MDVEQRLGSQVPNARLNGDAAIWLDDEQTVVSDRTADEATRRNANAAHFRFAALRPSDPFLPLKLFGSAVEGFFQKSAGAMTSRSIAYRADGCLTFGAVDFANFNLIEPELASCLGNNRFHDDDSLHS